MRTNGSRRARLVVMAKAPCLGRVKTRLAREIGPVPALRCARTMLRHTLLRLARDPRFATVLAITPDHAPFAMPGITTIPQGRGDLGARMRRLLSLEPGTILIGCDIPAVSAEHVTRAFRKLSGADAILGPAEDGGYWLVGTRGHPRTRQMFRNVRWSGPAARSDTLGNLAGASLAFADTLPDLDDAAAYAEQRAMAERLIPPAPSPRRPASDAPPASA